MTQDTMVPCFKCGKTLRTVDAYELQPSEGTTFRTYGHYGSTFWDSMDGEEIAIIICDECLRNNTGNIARHKRYKNITCDRVLVGRQWITREPVPYFDGQEDYDAVEIEPEEIGTLEGFSRIEWVNGWEAIKQSMLPKEGE